ncbi:MAG: alpha/beta hydrolase [Planctomycetota bacterium]
MADFVLVHGSGQNAASWHRVAALLRARGHTVATPELPKGSPPRAPAEHAAAVAGAMPGDAAIVVAHSLCGALLPFVAQLRPCRARVYLAAVIPEPGKSVREQYAADATMFDPEWIASGAKWFDPAARDELARRFLFHDCDAATLPWAMTTLATIDPALVVTTPSPRRGGSDAAMDTVIVATRDRTLRPDWIARRSREAFGVEAVAIDAGHCPHVSRPDAVAAALAAVANA